MLNYRSRQIKYVILHHYTPYPTLSLMCLVGKLLVNKPKTLFISPKKKNQQEIDTDIVIDIDIHKMRDLL